MFSRVSRERSGKKHSRLVSSTFGSCEVFFFFVRNIQKRLWVKTEKVRNESDERFENYTGTPRQGFFDFSRHVSRGTLSTFFLFCVSRETLGTIGASTRVLGIGCIHRVYQKPPAVGRDNRWTIFGRKM